LSNEFEKFEEYINKRYEKFLDIDKPDDEQKAEMKKMKQFLILAFNIYDLKENAAGIGENDDFYAVLPAGEPNSYDKEGLMVEDPSLSMPTITDPDMAEKMLRTLQGPTSGRAGFPRLDFFDETERIRRMVRDGVPDHVIDNMREVLGSASWGVPGTAYYDRFKEIIDEGKENEIARKARHFPRTMQDNAWREDEATQKLIGKHIKGLDFQHDGNETIDHNEWTRTPSPQIETQPEMGAAVDVDKPEDMERSESPLDMAWSNILKNLEISQ